MPHTGHCLCEGVKITLDETFTSQVACHCISCQKSTGSPFGSGVMATQDKVHIEGPCKVWEYTGFNKDNVKRYSCERCGSAIWHTTSFMPKGKIIVHTGNLYESFKNIPFDTESNAQHKWTGLPRFPGAEIYQTSKADGIPAKA